MPDSQAVDFWDAPDPNALGAINPWPYTGNAQPSDAWFAAVDALHNSPQVMIQETYSQRSQEGYAAGVYDCQFAEARARKHGVGIVDYVISDGNSADVWDASDYGRGISDTATLRYFGYGAPGVLASFFAGALTGKGAGLLVRGLDGAGGEHVPSTWGNANLVTQVVGPSPIPGTDLNLVHIDLEADDMAFDDAAAQRLNEVYAHVIGIPDGPFKTQSIVDALGAHLDAQTQTLVAAIHSIGGGGGGVTPEQTAAIQQSVTALEAATTALKTAFPA